MVLKVCPPEGDDGDLAAWDAPRREALAYASGFLDQLPGPLVAPRCLGLTEFPDGSVWLWLEEIVDECLGQRSIDRFVLAAQHLGASMVPSSPPAPFPTTPGSAAIGYGGISRQRESPRRRSRWQSMLPVATPVFPPPVTLWLRELWAERETFLTALDRLPQTICHHDAFRRNLFARHTADGQVQTVAIDWAFAGIGAVGAELTPLVLGSLGFFEVRDCTPRELAEAALAGYVTGLREADWKGDESLARLGFLASAALLYTVGTAGLTKAIVSDPAQYPAVELAMGWSMAEAVAKWAELSTFKIELVEEARRLLSSPL